MVREISHNGNYSQYNTIYVSSPFLKRKIKSDSIISSFELENKYYNRDIMNNIAQYTYSFNFDDEKDMMSIKVPVRLYSKNYMDKNETWSIIALFEEKEMTRFSQLLDVTILKSILLATILSLVVAYFINKIVSRPVSKISENIKNIDTTDDINIEKTGVVEYDNLIDVIEGLSHRLSKFKNVVNYSGIPFVVLEVNEKKKILHKMGVMNRILPGCRPNEKFEEYFVMDAVKNMQNMFGELKVIEKYRDVEMGNTTEIIEKLWHGDTRYIKVVTNIVDIYSYKISENYDEDKNVIVKIITDATKEITEKIQIKKGRDIDTLTGLLNRLSFKEKVTNYIKNNSYKKAAMIMWDMDDLKYVNDTYGHDYGDEYLRLMGKIIGKLQDDNSFVARVSGDEFFAFVQYEKSSDVMKLVYDIREELLNSYLKFSTNDGVKIRVTTGIAWYPIDSDDYDMLMKYADFAMYTAKHSKKGSIELFNKELYEKNHILLSGRENLNRFIEERQVRFAFQPIVDAKNGEVYSYEALMRATSKYIKTVYDVLRLVKAQSKLSDIETITYLGVLEYVYENQEQFKDKKIFINSLPNAVVPTKVFDEVIEKYSSIFANLVIEILEQEEADEDCMNMKKIFKKKYNCKIAIDDFGSGYATEAWLLEVNPDFVKIDMGIIRDIDKDHSRQKIVENILSYAKSKNIKVICEGVETYEELEQLISMGVDFVQGYYIRRPDFEAKDIDTKIKNQIIALSQKYRKNIVKY